MVSLLVKKERYWAHNEHKMFKFGFVSKFDAVSRPPYCFLILQDGIPALPRLSICTPFLRFPPFLCLVHR